MVIINAHGGSEAAPDAGQFLGEHSGKFAEAAAEATRLAADALNAVIAAGNNAPRLHYGLLGGQTVNPADALAAAGEEAVAACYGAAMLAMAAANMAEVWHGAAGGIDLTDAMPESPDANQPLYLVRESAENAHRLVKEALGERVVAVP